MSSALSLCRGGAFVYMCSQVNHVNGWYIAHGCTQVGCQSLSQGGAVTEGIHIPRPTSTNSRNSLRIERSLMSTSVSGAPFQLVCSWIFKVDSNNLAWMWPVYHPLLERWCVMKVPMCWPSSFLPFLLATTSCAVCASQKSLSMSPTMVVSFWLWKLLMFTIHNLYLLVKPLYQHKWSICKLTLILWAFEIPKGAMASLWSRINFFQSLDFHMKSRPENLVCLKVHTFF